MSDLDLAAVPVAVDEASAPPVRRWRHRLVWYLATVWLLLTLNFWLPRAMPGDPVATMLASANAGVTDATRAAAERYYGLDRPLVSQYGSYVAGLARGDLGVSLRHNRPVSDLVGERLPWTLLLGGTAALLSTALGLIAGIHAGWRRGRGADRALVGSFIAIHAVPPFFLAPLAIMVFSVKLGWFPLGGGSDAFSGSAGLVAGVVDVAHHLVLPAMVATVLFASFQFLTMRAGMVGELGSDYLLMGRAKGVADRRLQYRYAARNALLPVVATAGMALGSVVSTGILVEAAFAYPGMGRLLFDSVAARDYPAIQGCFLVVTLLVVSCNFAADRVHARLDPRVEQ